MGKKNTQNYYTKSKQYRDVGNKKHFILFLLQVLMKVVNKQTNTKQANIDKPKY